MDFFFNWYSSMVIRSCFYIGLLVEFLFNYVEDLFDLNGLSSFVDVYVLLQDTECFSEFISAYDVSLAFNDVSKLWVNRFFCLDKWILTCIVDTTSGNICNR